MITGTKTVKTDNNRTPVNRATKTWLFPSATKVMSLLTAAADIRLPIIVDIVLDHHPVALFDVVKPSMTTRTKMIASPFVCSKVLLLGEHAV